MKKGTVILLALVIVALAAMTGCSKSNTEATSAGTGTSTGTTKKEASTRDDLIVIFPNDLNGLDAQKMSSMLNINFGANIFDTLVSFDENNNIQPALAESWEVSEDGKAYTFHIRKGVKFHNGTELKAKDVAFSGNRYVVENSNSFMIDRVEATDEYTAVFHLKYPYGYFLNELHYFYVTSEAYFNSIPLEEFSRKPVGTGPYQFVEWSSGQKIVLKANDDYWGGAPKIKNVTVKIIPDSNTALVALETGEADFYFKGSALDLEKAKKASKLTTDSGVSNYFYYLNFNSDKLSKPVRQALAYAVDRDTINTIVTEGTGKIGNIPLSENQEGYTTDVATYNYDPEKAKQLLKEAGAENLTIDFFYGESSENKKLGQALQSQFNAVGVNLTLRSVETGTWWDEFEKGDYFVSRGGYPMELASVDSPFYSMYHSTGVFNISRIKNPAIDSLLEQARIEGDSKKRSEAYVKVNQIVAEEAYFVPLYFTRTNLIYNSNLQGVKVVKDEKYLYSNYSWK